MTRSFTKQAAALVATCGLAATCAMAQPTPDVTVTVNSAGTQVAGAITLAPTQVKWIRVDLGVDVNATTANFLDVIGGNTAGTDLDTLFALWSPTGVRLATADDEGPGLYPQLSLGGGCGATARTLPAGEGVPPLTAGGARNGGLALTAGTYWISVTGFGGTVYATNGWGVTTTHTRVGDVNTTFVLGTAGGPPVAPASAEDLGTLSNPTTLNQSANFAGTTVKWYRLVLPDIGAAFGNSYLDINNAQGATGGLRGTSLALYRADGTLVAQDGFEGASSYGALSFGLASPTRPANGADVAYNGRDGATVPAGTYYLGVAYDFATVGATCFGLTTTATALAADTLTEIRLGNFSSLPPSGTSAFGTTSVNNCGTATSLLTTTVTPGSNPVSTGLSVTADLSAMGGSATQQMFDDGSNGDVTPNNNVFSFLHTVPNTVTAGAKVATMTVTETNVSPRSTTNTATLTVTACPPPPAVNDECANAIVIGPGSGSYPFSTAGASASTGFTYCTGFGGDVFYSWTAPATGSATINNCGTANDDTVIAVYASCAGGASIACSDDFCGAQSSVTFAATQGTTYIVAVKNYSSTNPVITGTLNIIAPSGVSVAAGFSPTTANNCGTGTALLTAVFTPAPDSTGITATANLTDIDPSLSATQTMFDDGTNGDATGGDNTFSYLVTVPAAALIGAANVTVTASDAQSRTAADLTNAITITTCPPTAPACPAGTTVITTAGLDSGGQLVGPNFPNGSASNIVTASGLIADEIRISGLVQEINTATWASELRLRVTSPTGVNYDFQPSPVAGAAGTAAERGFDEPAVNGGFRSWTLLSQAITPEPADGLWTVLAYEAPEVTGSGIFDDGSLDATWINVCVTIAGTPALPTCGSIDFNGDGLFPDDTDLVEFLTVLAGGDCSPGNTCDIIDFNRDGLFPDDTDLVDFLTVLAGGTPSACIPQ